MQGRRGGDYPTYPRSCKNYAHAKIVPNVGMVIAPSKDRADDLAWGLHAWLFERTFELFSFMGMDMA